MVFGLPPRAHIEEASEEYAKAIAQTLFATQFATAVEEIGVAREQERIAKEKFTRILDDIYSK